MNKLFHCDLEIQGKGVLYPSKISCNVTYHSDIVTPGQSDIYEHILEQVFKLVVKEFSQKPVYGEFEIKGFTTDLSMSTIEKDLIENGPTLSQYSFGENEVKIELTNGSDWCYSDIFTEAMKRFFNLHYIELSGASLVHQHFAGRNDIIQQQKASLRSLIGEYECLTDEINSTIIGARNAGKRQQKELEEKLSEFEKQLH
ncbi:hypothetical protein J5751_03925 [bacterium]|nr:hypothetical protein [bacterium]